MNTTELISGQLPTPLIAVKMDCRGNSFLITTEKFVPDEIQKICNPRTGIGVDGVVVLKELEAKDSWKFNFFNNDGSQFLMCFNASLCAGALLLNLYPHFRLIRANCRIGELEIYKEGPCTNLRFTVPSVQAISYLPLNKVFSGSHFYIPLADPHIVILVDEVDFDDTNFISKASAVRRERNFTPKGSNVHIIAKAKNTIRVRHFERGVEGETLSCGSGCVAAAYLFPEENHLIFESLGGVTEVRKYDENNWAITGKPKVIASIGFSYASPIHFHTKTIFNNKSHCKNG